jgi:hypothetical protein
MKIKILLLSLTLSLTTIVGAQNVTIPDANFALWLSTSDYSACITGNQLDTACVQTTIAGMVMVPTVSCSYSNIVSLEGIQYFTGLKQLIADGNQILIAPEFPASLELFWASDNGMTNIPAFNDALETITVENNQLVALPALPNSLEQLWCGNNQITVLPQLSNTQLRDLGCGDNLLTTLPTYPQTLEQIYASDNDISSLPLWSDSIDDVILSSNQLTSIPGNLNNMRRLNISSNLIDSLPALPNTIEDLLIDDNLITELPSLPSSLEQFWCDQNQISVIPPLPNGIVDFQCANNFITCLPELPNSIVQIGFVGGGNDIQCAPNFLPSLATGGANNINNFPLCDAANFNGCQVFDGISGKIFSDENGDCDLTMGEAITSGTVLLQNSANDTIAFLTTNTGAFSFSNLSNDTYTLTYIDGLGVEISCLGSESMVINYSGTASNENNFGITCETDFDLSFQTIFTQGSQVGDFFPGQTTTAYVVLGDITNANNGVMNCASGISGTVEVTFSGPVTFNGFNDSTFLPTTVNGNTFTYAIADFDSINNMYDFGFIFTTDSLATATDFVCFDISIEANTTELDTTNNYGNFCIPVSNSYDPNIKNVWPSGEVLYPFNEELKYTIYFQNTGTAAAINIRLEDQLDTDLDWSTLKVLGSSHPLQTLQNGQDVTFKFDNIMLPDSLSNPEGSIGWVSYSIEPKTDLPVGTDIENFADIFFDFNAPITTNTALTRIVGILGLPNYSLANLSLYPNPTEGDFTIDFNNQEFDVIQIMGLDGKFVLNERINTSSQKFNVSEFPSGIYIVNLVKLSGEKTTLKLIKK